jgi:hypothetical protein
VTRARTRPPTLRSIAALAVLVGVAALAAGTLVACGGDDDGAEVAPTDTEVPMTDPSTGKPLPPDRLPGTDPSSTDPPSTDPPTTGTPATEPPANVTIPSRAQARVDAAVADLAARLSVEASDIAVVDYRDVTWADGSLGCPEPDMSYIQRLTPGTLLVLGAPNGVTFEYHGGPSGDLSYCASPRPPVAGQGAD